MRTTVSLIFTIISLVFVGGMLCMFVNAMIKKDKEAMDNLLKLMAFLTCCAFFLMLVGMLLSMIRMIGMGRFD